MNLGCSKGKYNSQAALNQRFLMNINLMMTLFILTSLLLGCTSTTMYSPDTPLVVVAHGLGRSDLAMRGLKNSLADAGYAVCRLNYSSIGQSLQEWKEKPPPRLINVYQVTPPFTLSVIHLAT